MSAPARPFASRSGPAFLTFDDGPDPVWTPRVLDQLARVGARATFFVMAGKAARHREIVARAREEGHGIELHCLEHRSHAETEREEIERDTAESLEILMELGFRPRRWRPPTGVVAPWTEAVAEAHGLKLAGWSADSRDWLGWSWPQMLGFVRPWLLPGCVIVMHDATGQGAPRPHCGETVALIAPLVAELRRRGLRPATLEQGGSVERLRRVPAAAPAPPPPPKRRRRIRDARPRHLLTVPRRLLRERRARRIGELEFDFERRDEEALRGRERRAVCDLLARSISREPDLYRERGWRTIPPAFRILVRSGEEVAGQVSAFAISTEPAYALYGLGDGVIDPRYRAAGLGRAMMRAVVDACWRENADLILGDTVALRTVLLSFGFVPVPRLWWAYERGGACHWRPNWLAAGPGALPGPLLLAEGDF